MKDSDYLAYGYIYCSAQHIKEVDMLFKVNALPKPKTRTINNW